VEGLVTSAPPAAPEYFGERVARYDGAYDGPGADGYALRSRMSAVIRLVGDGPGGLLDAGMGAGRLCAELERQGWTVSGIDASAEMVGAARARLPEARERLVHAPIEELPFPDGTFDVVTATGVLEYANVPDALAEVHRVLRPGGYAVVSYPNPRALYGLWKTRLWYPAIRGAKRLFSRPNPQMPHGASELPPAAFVDALRRSGLCPEALTYTSYLPVITPLERLLPRTAARLGERVERRLPRSGRLLAIQVVYRARKPAVAPSDEQERTT
jgi:SAM-dependent methyltransferase